MEQVKVVEEGLPGNFELLYRLDIKLEEDDFELGGDSNSSSSAGGSDPAAESNWLLTASMRVRVTSKELEGGRLYGRQARVLILNGPPKLCSIQMVDGSQESFNWVHKHCLEPALFREGMLGQPVLVVSGEHTRVYGFLVHKDSRHGTAVVREADTHRLFNVGLHQIANYLDCPSLRGYSKTQLESIVEPLVRL